MNIVLYSLATISGVMALFCLIAVLFGRGFGSKTPLSNTVLVCLVVSLFFYQIAERNQAKLEVIHPQK